MASVQPRVRCDCNRKFATPSALAQHRRDSPRHREIPQTNAPSNTVPTPTSEDATKGEAATPVVATKQTSTTNANSAPAPNQESSTSQTKQNKKKNRGGKRPQASASSGSSTFNPRSYWGYTLGEGLGYPRYSSGLDWEDEYRFGGLDHTMCSRDCDWCGMCAYRISV